MIFYNCFYNLSLILSSLISSTRACAVELLVMCLLDFLSQHRLLLLAISPIVTHRTSGFVALVGNFKQKRLPSAPQCKIYRMFESLPLNKRSRLWRLCDESLRFLVRGTLLFREFSFFFCFCFSFSLSFLNALFLFWILILLMTWIWYWTKL